MTREPRERPLPRRLAALSPGVRLLIAAVGILVGLAIIVGGLKLIDDDVNAKNPAPTTSTTSTTQAGG